MEKLVKSHRVIIFFGGFYLFGATVGSLDTSSLDSKPPKGARAAHTPAPASWLYFGGTSECERGSALAGKTRETAAVWHTLGGPAFR
jgi:hypothetical protein